MSTRKIRCSFCKQYVLRDVAVRSGIQAFCSLEHRQNYHFEINKRQKQRQQKRQIDPGLRSAVISADGGCCRFCGVTSNLHVHHVRYRSEGGEDAMENLITLCGDHHAIVHSNKNLYQNICFSVIDLRKSGDTKTSIAKLLQQQDRFKEI